MTCRRLVPPSRKVLPRRTSSCVRRGVNIVPGLIKGTTREVLAPPESGRPRLADASAWVMGHCARICCPGRFCSTPPIWMSCHGSVYDPFSFACVSTPDVQLQYENVAAVRPNVSAGWSTKASHWSKRVRPMATPPFRNTPPPGRALKATSMPSNTSACFTFNLSARVTRLFVATPNLAGTMS